ncbi:MAG: sulfur carrier protein ThiS [Thiovulaceae bacterium]|nr:sulfur carrier protein ThiS [Sulfurimonadaceae bacterium]
MNLTVNGETRKFEQEVSLVQIMQQLKIEDQVMAAAVNMEVVKKELWNEYMPKEGDKIEMLHFVGGG